MALSTYGVDPLQFRLSKEEVAVAVLGNNEYVFDEQSTPTIDLSKIKF